MVLPARRTALSRRGVLALAVLFSLTGTAGASVLDQSYSVFPVLYGAPVHWVQNMTQSFTVGQTGLLDRVELQVGRQANPTAPLVIELRRATPPGYPDLTASGLLASVTAQPSLIPQQDYPEQMVGFDLGAQAVPVVEGEMLALLLHSETGFDPGQFYVWASSLRQADYPGGVAGEQDTRVTEVNIDLSQDRGFRTFVTPEPSAAVAALAAAAFALVRRRPR